MRQREMWKRLQQGNRDKEMEQKRGSGTDSVGEVLGQNGSGQNDADKMVWTK